VRREEEEEVEEEQRENRKSKTSPPLSLGATLLFRFFLSSVFPSLSLSLPSSLGPSPLSLVTVDTCQQCRIAKSLCLGKQREPL